MTLKTITKKLRNSDAGLSTYTISSDTYNPSAFELEIGREATPTIGSLNLDSLTAVAGASAKAFVVSISGDASGVTFSTAVKTQGGTTTTLSNNTGSSTGFSLAATTAGTVVVTVTATESGVPDSPTAQDFSIVVS